MRSEFKLTEDANVLLIRITKYFLILMVAAFGIFYAMNFPVSDVSFLIGPALIFIILLYSLKHYKVIGKITFGSDSISIQTDKISNELPVNTILRIKYYMKAHSARSYVPTFFEPIGAKVAHGSGNMIEIYTDDRIYKFDILLRYSYEFNSLEHQFKRLAVRGLKIQKVKLASLLGDHF